MALGIVRRTQRTVSWLVDIDQGRWRPRPDAIPGGLRHSEDCRRALLPVLALPTHGMGHATEALKRPLFERLTTAPEQRRGMP